ncbi:MAG: NAD(P)-dependent oxidoreductase [Pseudomonadota bacterium]|nr:NAD(P)-dependent oxidoreductase [Pseudomonadota bacterium]
MKRLLITGAAGRVGSLIRDRVGHLAENLRLSDIAAFEAGRTGAEIVVCDLADAPAVERLVAGCDGIVHLGGISGEDTFERIQKANYEGVYNLYEAARAHGAPRIVFASSNHVVGYHPQSRRLDGDAPLRPDGLYGVSKCYGEALASMYHDKFGIETARVRIGSCYPVPTDHRMLSTWLSPDDFISLLECVFRAPYLGCPVIYGVSDNDAVWWDNSGAAYLGWKPKANSAAFREEIEGSMQRPDPHDPAAYYQGGNFTRDPIHK